jgi:ABC-2 type transport system permease protein
MTTPAAATDIAGPEPSRIASRPVPDLAQVRAILKATLRRSTRGRMIAGRSGKPRGLIFVLVMYAVLGGFLSMLAFAHPDVFTFSLVMGAYTFMVAGMTMVGESSTMLFDPAENDILGHRPIHPRTLLLAKSLGMISLTLVLGLAINLFPMFAGLATRGARWWFPLAHLVTLVLLVLFCSAVVVFVYALLARLVSRRTFDTVASWSQVVVTAVLIVSYQIVPRLMDRMQGFRIDAANPLLLFLPPTWFASVTQVLLGADTGPRMVAMAAAAVLATPVVGWAALRYLAGDYARQLSALGETSVAAKPAERTIRSRRWTVDALLAPWLRDPVERASFRLAAAYLGRDRDVRMRIYPQLALFVVFPVISIIDRSQGSRFGVMLSVYFAATIPSSVMMTLKASPHHAAADLFRYAPIAGTASIFHGVRKASLVLLVLPALIVSGSILWFGLPDHHSLLTAVPALLALPTLSLFTGLAGDYIPLSLPPTAGRQGAINVGMMLVGGIGGVVFVALGIFGDRAHWFWKLIVIEVAALAVLHPLLLRGIRVRPLRREGE